MKLVKPKPDISLAKKTGHFNLLTTDLFETLSLAHDMSGEISKRSVRSERHALQQHDTTRLETARFFINHDNGCGGFVR